MGSTIVMIIEINKNAEILIKNGDTVKYGQNIIKNNWYNNLNYLNKF